MNKVSLINKLGFKKPNKNINSFKLLSIIKKLKIRYPIKSNYKSIIPLNIFQTWHTKQLPLLMNNSVNYIKQYNQEFTHYLFDDDECRNYIKENFNISVLNAFDSLIPGAYKADLWRYCILYKKGGIYLDIKYVPVNGFKFIALTEKEHFVLDADRNGIYNALLVCLPGNEKLLKCINKIVENVTNKFYGANSLEPTGPLLLEKYFNKYAKKKLDMRHEFFANFSNRYIHLNNFIVFKQYNGYLDEHKHNRKVGYYGDLWNARQIYK